MISYNDCICGKHMLEHANEGSCVWCGHGEVRIGPSITLRQLRRVSRDLGSLNREGRRPVRNVHYVNDDRRRDPTLAFDDLLHELLPEGLTGNCPARAA